MIDRPQSDSQPYRGGFLGKERRHAPEESNGYTVVKLISGDCYVTNQPNMMLVTILGSCVAACIRDPVAKVGGMNHFLLPETDASNLRNDNDALRYGAYSMERLINEILKLGGLRGRLEVKVFGGGNVIDNSAMIGDRNIQFVKEFLKREGLSIAGEDLGDTCPRRVNYYPDTGRVMLRKLHRKDDFKIIEQERKYANSLRAKPVEGEIDLF